MVGIFSFKVQTKASCGLSFQVGFTGDFSGQFRTFKMLFSPLFIPGASGFRVREHQVSRVNACFSPDYVCVAVNGFCRIRYVLGVAVRITGDSVDLQIAVLVLAKRSTVRGEGQYHPRFFKRRRMFVGSRSMTLMVVERRAINGHVLPTVLVREAVLCQACQLLPIVANYRVHPFRGAATKRARSSQVGVYRHLNRVFAGSIFVPFPNVCQGGEGIFRVCNSFENGRGTRRYFEVYNAKFRGCLVFFPFF